MKKTIFTGSGVAIITPMNSDFSIDYDTFGKLIDFQIANGTDALIIAGTTGEASTLTDEEHIELIRFGVERAAGRVPVVAGTGSNDTAYAITLTAEAKKVGADATLQVTPYYNKTSQRGLIAHYTAIADAVDIPMIVYNVPGRTGVNIAATTYAELSKHPNIVATKEANGDITSVARAMALCGDNLDFYTGDDGMITPLLSLGGKGVISVIANIAPKETSDICKLFFDGDVIASGKMQADFIDLIDSMFIDVNPIPVKAAVNLLGYNAGNCRLPLVDLSVSHLDVVKKAMKNHGLI